VCVCVCVCVGIRGLGDETVPAGGVGRHTHYSQARIWVEYTLLFGRIQGSFDGIQGFFLFYGI